MNVTLPPIADSYFDSPGTKDVVTDFVKRFFQQYDTPKGRQALLPVYTPTACFSLCLTKGVRMGLANPKYLAANRNLLEATGEKKSHERYSSLRISPIHIIHQLDTMPATVHNINELLADSFNIPQKRMMQVVLKGTFLDDSQETYTFHRVFLLIPAPAGSVSPVLIQNDMLYIGPAKPNAGGGGLMPGLGLGLTLPGSPGPAGLPIGAADPQQAMVRPLLLSSSLHWCVRCQTQCIINHGVLLVLAGASTGVRVECSAIRGPKRVGSSGLES